MKSHPFRYALAALALLGGNALVSSAQAGTNVGVSVSVNQPGFYGRVDIGAQPPVLLYPQPVVIQQSPVAVMQRPIYMRVPPGHSRDWARYCGRYSACGQPVYFVQDGPRDRHERHEGRGWDDGDRRGYRDDRRDDRRDERYEGRGDRGGDHDRGNGHGRGHRD